MTQPKRRVIDIQQRMPANVAAAPAPDHTPKVHEPIGPATQYTREHGRKRVPVESRAIPIERSPVPVQVPVQGASRVNSSLALAKKAGAQPGGAEAEVAKRRKQEKDTARDTRIGASVIK